jgi:transcriptional regulator GlxA family with amidase domain
MVQLIGHADAFKTVVAGTDTGSIAATFVARQDQRMTRPHEVVFVVVPDISLLDMAGAVEVLSAANAMAGRQLYRTIIATQDGAEVRAESGVRIAADCTLASLAGSRRRVDTLVVVGGPGVEHAIADESLLQDINRVSRRADRTMSVCTGALALAAAGLLDGYEATTHWARADMLASFPGVDVNSDRIFVRDRDRWTSAGVASGIDLFLALVDADHGPELAHKVAGWLVVYVRRSGGQAQFSAQLRAQPATTPPLAELQRWLNDHLGEDLRVDVLAARVNMSSRNFARAFRRETGTTPAAFVEQLRIEAARRLLETSDLSLADIAYRVGIGRTETLHRAFSRRVGTTPARYRQNFGRSAS